MGLLSRLMGEPAAKPGSPVLDQPGPFIVFAVANANDNALAREIAVMEGVPHEAGHGHFKGESEPYVWAIPAGRFADFLRVVEGQESVLFVSHVHGDNEREAWLEPPDGNPYDPDKWQFVGHWRELRGCPTEGDYTAFGERYFQAA